MIAWFIDLAFALVFVMFLTAFCVFAAIVLTALMDRLGVLRWMDALFGAVSGRRRHR